MQQWIVTLVSIGVLALVLFLRVRRMKKITRLRVERLWMLPAFYAAIVVVLYAAHPPAGLIWLYALLALIIGGGAGWYRGKLMRITVDPQTHEVSQQGSAAAMIFIFVLVALRFAGRSLLIGAGGESPEAMIAISDVLLPFGLGFIGMQRLEMGLRARKLLDAARSSTP